MNVADASLAWCPPGTGAAFVAGAGAVAGVRRRALVPGDPVHKVGRTTGLTFGTVLAVHATVAVDYSWIGLPEGTAWYREQIVTSPMSAYGDSGALLLDAAGLAAGLLFGGSLTCTLFNPINAVLEILGVALPAPEGRS
jgi:hypothetical protein